MYTFIICMAQIMALASLIQGIVPLRIIAASFGDTTPHRISWIVSSLPITLGASIIVGGRFGDVFGYTRVCILAFIWAALWSFLAGISVYISSSIFFDVCRVLGLGVAFALPYALAILERGKPRLMKRNLLLALFGACAPIGAVLGGSFAAMLAQLDWWPWVFWITAIVNTIVATLATFYLPRIPPSCTAEMGEMMWRLDVVGSIIAVVGLLCINVSFNEAAGLSWSTPHVYILLIIGVLLLVVFPLIESRVSHPIAPSLLLTPSVLLVLLCLMSGWGALGIWNFYTFSISNSTTGCNPPRSKCTIRRGHPVGPLYQPRRRIRDE